MARLLPLLLAVLLGTGLVACDGGPVGDQRPRPEATAVPVEGTARIQVVDVAPRPVVPDGAGGVAVPAVDKRRARRFGRAAARWLDGHLNSLQSGDRLGALAGSALVAPTPGPTPDPALEAVTGGLAGPGQLVAAATYRIRVAARGGPEWAQARVRVRDRGGTHHEADFLFEPSPDGPRVVAFGPVPRARPPSGTQRPTGGRR